MLGKLSVPGRPNNLDNNRATAYCACSRCGCRFGHFFSRLSFLSPSMGDGQIKTEILSQRTVKPKTADQPMKQFVFLAVSQLKYIHTCLTLIFGLMIFCLFVLFLFVLFGCFYFLSLSV